MDVVTEMLVATFKEEVALVVPEMPGDMEVLHKGKIMMDAMRMMDYKIHNEGKVVVHNVKKPKRDMTALHTVPVPGEDEFLLVTSQDPTKIKDLLKEDDDKLFASSSSYLRGLAELNRRGRVP